MGYLTTGNFNETPYTAKILNRKFETYNPRKGTARLQSQIHRYIHVSVYDLNIPTIGLHILLQENSWTDRGNI
jgi:hypothetical protein